MFMVAGILVQQFKWLKWLLGFPHPLSEYQFKWWLHHFQSSSMIMTGKPDNHVRDPEGVTDPWPGFSLAQPWLLQSSESESVYRRYLHLSLLLYHSSFQINCNNGISGNTNSYIFSEFLQFSNSCPIVKLFLLILMNQHIHFRTSICISSAGQIISIQEKLPQGQAVLCFPSSWDTGNDSQWEQISMLKHSKNDSNKI